MTPDQMETTPAPTYADPAGGLTFTLKTRPVGVTYDPPRGFDWWLCPLCPRAKCDRAYKGFEGNYGALQTHIGDAHGLRVTDSTVTITLGRLFDDNGQVVRYVPDAVTPETWADVPDNAHKHVFRCQDCGEVRA